MHTKFEVIGCMFEHTLSGSCKYEDKCTKKLCVFQHESKDVSENELEENVNNEEEPHEMINDGGCNSVNDLLINRNNISTLMSNHII